MRIRRVWRIVLIGLALAAILLGFGVWRLARDDERLTRWLFDSVQSATGLTMKSKNSGRFGFWPRLSIALDDVTLQSAGEVVRPAQMGQTHISPIQIGSVRIQIPWSSVFGRELRVGAIVLDRVVIDSEALAIWLAQRRDAGPLPALRWPRLDAALAVRDLSYRKTGSNGDAVDVLALRELRLDRWRTNRPAVLDAGFSLAAFPGRLFTLQLTCTPRQSSTSIAIEPCSASLNSAGSAPLAVRGYLRHDDATRAELQLRIEAERLPDWISIAPIQAESKPVDLALRLIGAFAGPLKTKLGGTVAGIGVDVDALLPYGWQRHIELRQWNALAEGIDGHVRIDHLHTADARLDDIEWRNEIAPDSIDAAESAANEDTKSAP